MLIQIDTASAEPLYTQIVRAVRQGVARGEIRPGDRLPAARDLALSLDVNMHTVLRAYGELRDAGDIELRRGRGATVVARPKADSKVSKAVEQLLEVARQSGVSLEQLHEALDEGADR